MWEAILKIRAAVWTATPLLLLSGALVAVPAEAQESGSIRGRVLAAGGEPAADAQVRLVELRRRVSTAPDGSFHFENVPPGEYRLELASPRFGKAVLRVSVAAGGQAEVEATLERIVRLEEVVVTVSPEPRGVAEVYQPVAVLSERELRARLQPTLGETLAQEPGVTSTYFGPGASRPVIRGLGGDRIRVLDSGIGIGDVSHVATEHAVMSDPLSAERIEVVRGPATLLYGSSAVGGVVNVIDRRIPDSVPREPLTASLDLRGGTVADERGGALRMEGGVGPVAWQGGYLRRSTDDYALPAREVLPNSASDTEAGTVGLSYVSGAGFLGVSWGGHDTFYGIPGPHAHHGEEAAEGGITQEQEPEPAAVKIDQRLRRIDLAGGLAGSGVLRGLKLRLGIADYEHVELEGAEEESRWTNDTWEGRLEALHRPLERVSGALGVQLAKREFAAIGEEVFVPPSTTHARAVFAFEELDLAGGRWKLQAGARYETQDVEAAAAGERSFGGVSSSAGVIWLPAENASVALALSRAVRLPTAEELFTDGPHAARGGFVIGDPDLSEEKSLAVDLSFRKRAGRLAGELNLFASRFDDFIFEEFTGEEQDGLSVLRYVQRDARFLGGEFQADVELLKAGANRVALELTADAVRAELADGDEPLPRIPPLRLSTGLHYEGERLWGLVEARRVSEQERVAPFEDPTEGYTFLNASIGFRFFLGGLAHDLVLRGTNLTDDAARNHVSFLKEVAPLPGRDIGLSYTVSF